MFLKRLIGSKAFYNNLFVVMIPILIQNGITNFISLLDNIMVGQVGTEQMAGVSIVNQLLLVFNLCIFGAVSGAGLFSSQFFGKKDHDGVRYTFRFKIYISVVLYLGAMALFLFAGEPLINLYLHEGGDTGDLVLTTHYAKEYLAISLLGLLPYTVTQIYAGTLREVKHALPPMTAGLIGVGINSCLNYLLIFGKLGLPQLGVRGAAIATVIARLIECLIVVLWTHFHSLECPFVKGLYSSFRIPTRLMRRILITGLPLIVNEALWSAGQAALLQCYSYRGLAVVSAMNISGIVSNTFAVLYLSMGSTISILVGHRLGAGELREAREDARKMIAFSIALGLFAGALIALCAPIFPQIYNTTEEVRSLATSLTFVVALAAPLHAIVNASYFTLRSGGKTVLTFLFDSLYVWGVSIVLAFCLTHFTALPILLIYLICQLVDIFKCILGIALVNSGIWVRDITKSAQNALDDMSEEKI